MQTIILVICTIVGLLIGGYQFRAFPWKEKPSTRKLATALLLHLAVGGGIGFLMGGWLAGQLEQLF